MKRRPVRKEHAFKAVNFSCPLFGPRQGEKYLTTLNRERKKIKHLVTPAIQHAKLAFQIVFLKLCRTEASSVIRAFFLSCY